MRPQAPVVPELTREHTAELTSNAALLQPIKDLALTEEVPDTETVVSLSRRASASEAKNLQNKESFEGKAAKEYTRHGSVQRTVSWSVRAP